MTAAAGVFAPPPRRIAVFRALHLGDLLCAVPALRALRAAAPEARITLIGLPWAQAFVSRFDRYLDELLEFPGYPDFPERPCSRGELKEFLARVRGEPFDLALQLHGTGYEVNDIVMAMHCRNTAGFHPPEQPAPTRWFVPWPEREPEIRRYLRLTQAIGAPDRGDHLEFPLRREDLVLATRLLSDLGLRPGRYICLHAGARLPTRRWPAERFGEVAAYLTRSGWNVILTGGAQELELAAAVAATVPPDGQARLHTLAGQTDLGALAAVVAGARLLVSNDTGLSHVAAAVGTPSVIVSSGGDARRWAPLDHNRHRVLWYDLPCRPCPYQTCPIGHPCALAIEPEEVIETVEATLRDTEPTYE